mmetsp:Transcript_177734/g.432431  ORF Transcript_177734/g.432431 Transcript_177734/m.432431 type:complete len:212 (+) Transcript_177734:92-727(+)
MVRTAKIALALSACLLGHCHAFLAHADENSEEAAETQNGLSELVSTVKEFKPDDVRMLSKMTDAGYTANILATKVYPQHGKTYHVLASSSGVTGKDAAAGLAIDQASKDGSRKINTLAVLQGQGKPPVYLRAVMDVPPEPVAKAKRAAEGLKIRAHRFAKGIPAQLMASVGKAVSAELAGARPAEGGGFEGRARETEAEVDEAVQKMAHLQ